MTQSHEAGHRGHRGRTRVTHVVLDLQGGGLESLIGVMAERFHGSSIVVSVITLSGRAGRVGEAVRRQVDHFHTLRPVRRLSMLAPLGLARAIRATRPDVVHLHSGSWFKGVRAARLAGVRRVIYTEHGLPERDHWLAPWLLRRAAKRTDLVVTVSDILGGALCSRYGLARDRVVTVSNGVDVRRFPGCSDRTRVRTALGIPPGAVVLGSVGRFEPVKAYDRLIRAFADLRRDGALGTAPCLLLCGDGSERDSLRELARSLHVADCLRLPGWVEEPADFYRAMDVFALTSRSEGLPVSLLEAMASGVPPVVTDVGANAEVLGPDLQEQVVPAGDRRALMAALRRTVDGVRCGTGLERICRKRIVDHYDVDGMLDQYRGLYHSLGNGTRVDTTGRRQYAADRRGVAG